MQSISLDDLATVTGGQMKPTQSGVIQSERNPGGGVTVDWNGKNQQNQSRSPTDGVFPFRGGDGSNGQGGWAIG